MAINRNDICRWMCEATIKGIIALVFKSIIPAAIIMSSIKIVILLGLPFIILFIICLVILVMYVLILNSLEKAVLNDYKTLSNSNNFDIAYAEKWFLDILIERNLQKFDRSFDFSNLINREVEFIEKNYDPDEDVLALIYSTQKKCTDRQFINQIINNLISHEFVQEYNDKGLLKINDVIFSYVKTEKMRYERNKKKNEQKRLNKINNKSKKQTYSFLQILEKAWNGLKTFKPLGKNLNLSTLVHTWILDVDGTLVKHNGYKIDGYDTLLDGVKEFFASVPKEDKIVLLTARPEEYLEDLKSFLKQNNLRYDYLLTDMPMGERILVNDDKPSGLKCAYAVCKLRDAKLVVDFEIKKNL